MSASARQASAARVPTPGQGDLLNAPPSRNIYRPGREIFIRYVAALLPPAREGQPSLTRPIAWETLYGPPLDQVVARLLGRTGRRAEDVAAMPTPPAWADFGPTALVCARPGEPDWPLAFLEGLSAHELDAALALVAVGRVPAWPAPETAKPRPAAQAASRRATSDSGQPRSSSARPRRAR